MEQFAKELMAEVQKNYVPHMEQVHSDMTPNLPTPMGFDELYEFMQAHRGIQQEFSDRIWDVGDGTGGLASAAETVSKNYGNTDAFSHARVSDVQRALAENGVTAPQTPGGETVPPAQGTTYTTGG
ncbi:hypothetical protein [Plantactinospora sp. B5E13]|uniref:hypothetical protein n=1 Tax=Plantactinospora sp. B5E13 TaxID=3153758 RepID=UPI00325D1E68